ncbi:MAG: hypothetical protein Q4C96_06370 [Planctomycetia bacterium]|nr:hypothetical protein [Planctomycetia bacterium]
MKTRTFHFYVFCVCGLCIFTGIMASFMTAWILYGSTNNRPFTENAPSVVYADGCDRLEGFITCAGTIESNVEALYVLDTISGNLSAAVMAKKGSGFQAKYSGNVTSDLQKAITLANNVQTSKKGKSRTNTLRSVQMPSQPKYIMTTAAHDNSERRGNVSYASSALHITEVNTGITLTYVLPWNRTAHASNAPFTQEINCIHADRLIRPMQTEEE